MTISDNTLMDAVDPGGISMVQNGGATSPDATQAGSAGDKQE